MMKADDETTGRANLATTELGYRRTVVASQGITFVPGRHYAESLVLTLTCACAAGTLPNLPA